MTAICLWMSVSFLAIGLSVILSSSTLEMANILWGIGLIGTAVLFAIFGLINELVDLKRLHKKWFEASPEGRATQAAERDAGAATVKQRVANTNNAYSAKQEERRKKASDQEEIRQFVASLSNPQSTGSSEPPKK